MALRVRIGKTVAMADAVEPGGAQKATGALNGEPAPAASETTSSPAESGSAAALRLASLGTFLIAMVGAVALGLGISDYLIEHRYIGAYLGAYAGFRLADLLARSDHDVASAFSSRWALDQLPVLVLFAAAPFERTYLYGGEPPATAGALGFLIELAGLWLTLGARIQLGSFSSAAPPNLVRNGCYRHIRHPMYAGTFLVLIGWPLQYSAPITAIVMTAIYFVIVARRVRAEEIGLLERFGGEYAAYAETTDRMIPAVW